MKKMFKNKLRLFIPIVFYFSSNVTAQPSDRQYILENLDIWFVDNPSDHLSKRLLQTNTPLMSYLGFFQAGQVDAGELNYFNDLLKALYNAEDNGGDRQMQSFIASTLRIRNKKIAFMIYNDLSISDPEDFQNTYTSLTAYGEGNRYHIWPHANNVNASGPYYGFFHVGLFYPQNTFSQNHSYNNTLAEIKSTIIHELMHTQDRSDGRIHLFGYGYYGLDRNHYYQEVIPDIAFAYKEGIANTGPLLFDRQAQLRFKNWIANNGEIMVEEIMPNYASDLSPDNWLYQQIKNETHHDGEQFIDDHNVAYRLFPIRELSPALIMHNEIVLALIYSECAKKIGFRNFAYSISMMNNTQRNSCGSAIAATFEALCIRFSDNQTLDQIEHFNTNSSGNVTMYKCIYPLALADYLTGYQSQNFDQFKEIFERMMVGNAERYVNIYWNYARETVRSQIPVNPTGILDIDSDLNHIASALGVQR